MRKLCVSEFAQELDLTYADLFRNEEAYEPVRALAPGIVRIISAKPVVIGVLALDGEGPAVHHLFLHQKVDSGCRLRA